MLELHARNDVHDLFKRHALLCNATMYSNIVDLLYYYLLSPSAHRHMGKSCRKQKYPTLQTPAVPLYYYSCYNTLNTVIITKLFKLPIATL